MSYGWRRHKNESFSILIVRPDDGNIVFEIYTRNVKLNCLINKTRYSVDVRVLGFK